MEQITESEIMENAQPELSEAEDANNVAAEEDIIPRPTEPIADEIDTDEFVRSLLLEYPDADTTDEKLIGYASGRIRLSAVEAYRALNFDSLVEKAVKAAAHEAESKLIGHIRLCGIRPAENGTDRQNGGKRTPPVSRLSRAERAKIAARAGRGEHIEF